MAAPISRDGPRRDVSPGRRHLQAPGASANDLHEQIVDAIEERDGDKAARFMYEHIDCTRQIVDSWLRTGSSAISPRRSAHRG